VLTLRLTRGLHHFVFIFNRQDGIPLDNLTWTLQADVGAQFTVVALPDRSSSEEQQNPARAGMLSFACIIQVRTRDSSLVLFLRWEKALISLRMCTQYFWHVNWSQHGCIVHNLMVFLATLARCGAILFCPSIMGFFAQVCCTVANPVLGAICYVCYATGGRSARIS